MSVCHLYVVAENVVIADLERGYACGGDLTLLDADEVVLALIGDMAQLVELGVDTVSDDFSPVDRYGGCPLALRG